MDNNFTRLQDIETLVNNNKSNKYGALIGVFVAMSLSCSNCAIRYADSSAFVVIIFFSHNAFFSLHSIKRLRAGANQMRRYKKNRNPCHIPPLFFVTSRQITNIGISTKQR